MNFSLTEDQELLRRSERELLASEWPSAAMRRMLDDSGSASHQFWLKISETGWPALMIPEEYGGLGSGAYDLALLMEEMGRRLVPGTFLSTAVLAAGALQRMGNEEARRNYLPGIAEGRVKATLAVYAPNSGWDLGALRTSGGTDGQVTNGGNDGPVTDDGNEGPVTKSFVPDAAAADLIICVLREGDDVRLVVPHDPKITALETLDPTRALADVTFDPAEAETIGEGAIDALQRTIDIATVALAAEMVGGAAELLEVTVAYVKARRQFGRPVGSFQAVQHRAADMLISLEKARSAVYYAAIAADEQPERLALASSMAKVAANKAYRFASQQAIQLHGGIGFTWEQDLHFYLKRAKASEFSLGSTAWHAERIAAQLGF